MAPRRVLVTGSRGFVGRHIRRRLAEALTDAETVESACDITDPAAVAAEIKARRPDVCIHLAAVSAIQVARRDPDRAWRVNLHGTLAVADALLAHAPDCLLLFASSAECYGTTFGSGRRLDEEAVLAPRNLYAATKAAADLALGVRAAEGLRVVRLRAFNHTGPGQSPAFVVAAFAEQVARIAAGRQPAILRVGDLEPSRDLLDVRDVCAAYVACVDRMEHLPPGTILNIASGEPRRIGDILDRLLALAGVRASVEVDPARLRASDLPVTIGDSGRARDLLGWAPRIAWEQTLRDVLDDWRERVWTA